MKFLDIGQVAEKSGIKPSALRYYEEAGLIASVARHGLRRQFPPEVLLQLRLISMGKAAGFSLEEIARMFSKDGLPALHRASLHQRADEIDQQVHDLNTLSHLLRHVADCPAPSHMECPKFRRLVGLAAKRAGKRKYAKARRGGFASL